MQIYLDNAAITKMNKTAVDAMLPYNVGGIEDADGFGEVGNVKCGDIMKIYLKIENDIIVDVKFETFCCDHCCG